MIELTRTSSYTLVMDEEWARKISRAVSVALAKLDTTSLSYVEMVNNGHIDTLCWLKNAIQTELS